MIPPDPDQQNGARASWAEAALLHFIEVTSTEAADAIPDLLVDLAHLCDRQEEHYGTFQDALRRARYHYAAETEQQGTQLDVALSQAAEPEEALKDIEEQDVIPWNTCQTGERLLLQPIGSLLRGVLSLAGKPFEVVMGESPRWNSCQAGEDAVFSDTLSGIDRRCANYAVLKKLPQTKCE